MTKKLEEILNIDPKKEKIVEPPTAAAPRPEPAPAGPPAPHRAGQLGIDPEET